MILPTGSITSYLFRASRELMGELKTKNEIEETLLLASKIESLRALKYQDFLLEPKWQ